MFGLAVFLVSATLGILYWITTPDGLTLGNRARAREAIRIAALLVVSAVLLQSLLALFLPSPWS